MTTVPKTYLPKWADRWTTGRCGCGASLCWVDCAYCGGHVVCSVSAHDSHLCPKVKK